MSLPEDAIRHGQGLDSCQVCGSDEISVGLSNKYEYYVTCKCGAQSRRFPKHGKECAINDWNYKEPLIDLEVIKESEDIVEVRNPKSGKYVKVDRSVGKILDDEQSEDEEGIDSEEEKLANFKKDWPIGTWLLVMGKAMAIAEYKYIVFEKLGRNPEVGAKHEVLGIKCLYWEGDDIRSMELKPNQLVPGLVQRVIFPGK